MPNHMHGIIGIEYHPVGTIPGLSDDPDPDGTNPGLPDNPDPVRAIHELPLRDGLISTDGDLDAESYRKQRRQMLLSKMIGWYKMNVSKKANILLKDRKSRFWQRNYHEHIIRNEKSLNRIRNYILNNPAQWEEDVHYPDRMG